MSMMWRAICTRPCRRRLIDQRLPAAVGIPATAAAVSVPVGVSAVPVHVAIPTKRGAHNLGLSVGTSKQTSPRHKEDAAGVNESTTSIQSGNERPGQGAQCGDYVTRQTRVKQAVDAKAEWYSLVTT